MADLDGGIGLTQPETTRATGSGGAGAMLVGLVRSVRPQQWTKNGFVFFAPLFAHQLHVPSVLLRTVLAFVLFCALSGVVYLINDVADLERDRKHPEKRHRPIAAGIVPPGLAVLIAVVTGVIALGGSFMLTRDFGLIAVAYLLNNLLYSFYVKHLVILDVMSVAAGFLLRAVGGGVAIPVEISHWLVLCTTLLALFLATCKRRQELTMLATDAGHHRVSLKEYTVEFVDQMIAVVTASTLIAYCLYAFSPDVRLKLGTPYMGATIPFVLYGIFRYLYLVYLQGGGGNPSKVLLQDRPLQINILLWGLVALAMLYLR